MKRVKLYTLKEHDVVVTTDYMEYCHTDQSTVRVRDSGEVVLNAPVEVTRLPIEYYRRTINRGGLDYVESYLIAVEPKVRELLCSKEKQLKEEVDFLNKDNQILRGGIKTLNSDLEEANKKLQKLIEFSKLVNNLTFWQKLKLLFTKNIGDVK